MSSQTHESIDDRPTVEPFPSWPVLDEEMVDAVSTVLRSGRINYWTGNEGRQFEAEYAAHVGVDYAIAAANGTVTLDMALHALHIGAEDEVIVTPRSFIASASCVLLRGATPVFADVDRDSQNLTAETIAPVLTGRTKAIILVHLAGWPCEMDGILALAEDRGLAVIEDCAQAHRAMYRGRYVGTMGRIGCFSLQQSKQLATGEGGVCVTDDDDLGERMRLCMDKGWVRGPALRAYPVMGLNYRMNELTAAVALAQLRKLDDRVAARVRIGDAIGRGLEGIPGVHAPVPAQGDRNTYWFYSLYVDDGVGGLSPVEFASALAAEGIPASHGYVGRPMHLLYSPVLERRAYGPTGCPWTCPHAGRDIQYTPGDCPNAEDALQHLIMIGMNEFYTEREADDIVGAVRKVACSG